MNVARNSAGVVWRSDDVPDRCILDLYAHNATINHSEDHLTIHVHLLGPELDELRRLLEMRDEFEAAESGDFERET